VQRRNHGRHPLEQFALDSGGPQLPQHTGRFEFAAYGQHQILQRGIGPSNRAGNGWSVGPVDPIETLVADALHPQLDRGHAHSEAARHRPQGGPLPYGSGDGLAFRGRSSFCVISTSLPSCFRVGYTTSNRPVRVRQVMTLRCLGGSGIYLLNR
jgi:hypothetical protein